MTSKRALTGLLTTLALLACDSRQPEASRQLPPDLESTEQAIAETTREEAMAQAPWRVRDADSVIPIDVAIADAYRAGVFETTVVLDYVMVSVRKDGAWVPFYYRNFGLELADSPFTDTLFVLHITEGLGAGLIDRRPITARNLLGESFSTGLVELKVQVSATGPALGKSADIYVIKLQTRVTGTPLTQGWGRFENWWAGDLHAHSAYTHNFGEYALPHRSMLHAADAIGLDWVISTDHSCDLDPTCAPVPGIDNVSTRVERWTFCEGGQALPCTKRDNSALPDGLAMARSDALDAESWAAGWSSVKLHAGEEVNVLSSTGKILHMLAFDAPYIHSPGSGAVVAGASVDCDAVSLQLADALRTLPSTAITVSAHPTQPLDPKINGGAWSDDETFAALESSQFYGMQLWNMRKARVVQAPQVGNPESSPGLDPFTSYPLLGAPCDSAADPHECYPHFMELEAVPHWDRLLSRACSLPGRRVVGLAGTDSHGDFNYVTLTTDGLGVASANDAAFGTVRTVVLAPSGEMTDVLQAIREGRAVMTDGPMVTFGIDRTGDGTIDQLDEDGQVGSQWPVAAGAPLRLHFKWQSTAEYGDLAALHLVAGDATTADEPIVYDLFADPKQLGDCAAASRTSGACSVQLTKASGLLLSKKGARSYYRVVAYSGPRAPATGFYEYRALTNPIWLHGAACEDADGDGYFAGEKCDNLPGIDGGALDCDDAAPAVHPGAPETCNRTDDDCDAQTDEEIVPVACGVGACLRTVDGCANGALQQCVPGGPAPESCNRLDDDCDGQVDEDGVCESAAVVPVPPGCNCAAVGRGFDVTALLVAAGLLLLPSRRRSRAR